MIAPDQFNIVRPLFEALRKPTRPRTHDLYAIFMAVLYLIEHDLAWRQLPRGTGDDYHFPPWRTVNEYFSMWMAAGLLVEALAQLNLPEQQAKLAARLDKAKRYHRSAA